MAEFCVDCWNELNTTNEPKERFLLSDELELCEGCGKQKHTIIRLRRMYWLYRILCIRHTKG